MICALFNEKGSPNLSYQTHMTNISICALICQGSLAQLPSKTLSLFLAVVIRLVAGYCVWYCWHALYGSSQFASTQSIIRSVEFSQCKCSSHSTDTSPQGTAISNQYSPHFVFTRVTRIKYFTNSFLPRTPFFHFSHHSPYKSSFDTSRYNVDNPPTNTAPSSEPRSPGSDHTDDHEDRPLRTTPHRL